MIVNNNKSCVQSYHIHPGWTHAHKSNPVYQEIKTKGFFFTYETSNLTIVPYISSEKKKRKRKPVFYIAFSLLASEIKSLKLRVWEGKCPKIQVPCKLTSEKLTQRPWLWGPNCLLSMWCMINTAQHYCRASTTSKIHIQKFCFKKIKYAPIFVA